MEDSKLWPAPDKFDPDRFDEANSKARHPYAFCPFGFAGKRKCPAYRYSYLESTVLLASILRRFHVGLQVEQQVKHVYGFVTHPDVEIWVKVTKRT
ncbi:hypothetical protein RRG08_063901 [Elysia crispata]|uniref:Cytochrome P450 n=1 Tax=Elysia crispata TaxID=231223 RepID=A0AAE1CY05_9GAST|nr:hypothetical protein RRG08_063901 [Elysia crispata]